MRLYEFVVDEGYKEAEAEFTAASRDSETTKFIIDQYKKLISRNQIKASNATDTNQKNIDYWRKQGWDQFKQFVQLKSSQKSDTQIKRRKVVGQSITIQENENWLIVIPLDKEASCYHGAKSDWCTTKPFQPHYEEYVYVKNTTLIYCLNKQTGGMWAIAYKMDHNKIEFFDQNDKLIKAPEFISQTNLDLRSILHAAIDKSNQDVIQDQRTKWKTAHKNAAILLGLPDFAARLNKLIPALDKLLSFTKDARQCSEYIRLLAKHGVDTSAIPLVITMAALYAHWGTIQYFKNPSRQMQLAAVRDNGHAIKYINNPSDEILHVAIATTGDAIQFVKNPSVALQLKAVNKWYTNIQYIDNPSPEVQRAALQQNPDAVRYIKK